MTVVLFVGGPRDGQRQDFPTEHPESTLGVPLRYTHTTYELPHWYDYAEVEQAEADVLTRQGVDHIRLIEHEYRLAYLPNPNVSDKERRIYFYLYAGKR